MSFHVESLTVNPFAENTYVIVREGQALIVDPGFFYQAEFDRLLRILETHGAEPVAVLQTHAHIDHILGIPMVRGRWPHIPVYMHPDDLENWRRLSDNAARFGFHIQPIPDVTTPLYPTDAFQIGHFSIDVRLVPGHAPGHLVFYFADQGVLIAGDTLFQGSVGRTDLYRGDFETLAESIQSQIYTLPDATVVYPGHGGATTVGGEAVSNPYVRRS